MTRPRKPSKTPPKAVALHPLQNAPRLPSSWEVAVVVIPEDPVILGNLQQLFEIPLEEGGERPELLLISDPDEHLIRSFALLAAGTSDKDLQSLILEQLEEAALHPLGPVPPGIPAALLTEDPAILKLLREPLLALGIPVRKVDELASWAFLPSLLDHLFSESPSSMVAGAAYNEQSLCEQAAAIAAQKPWSYMDESNFFIVESDDIPITHPIISVIGSKQSAEGIICHRSVESIAIQTILPPPLFFRSEEDSTVQDSIFLFFYRRRELTKEERQAFDDQKITVSDGHYPRFCRAHFDYEVSELTNPGECMALAATLEALAGFLKEHRASFEDGLFPEIHDSIETDAGWEISIHSSPLSKHRYWSIVNSIGLPAPKPSRKKAPNTKAEPAKPAKPAEKPAPKTSKAAPPKTSKTTAPKTPKPKKP